MATRRPVTLPVLAPEAKGGSFIPAIAADATGMNACPRFNQREADARERAHQEQMARDIKWAGVGLRWPEQDRGQYDTQAPDRQVQIENAAPAEFVDDKAADERAGARCRTDKCTINPDHPGARGRVRKGRVNNVSELGRKNAAPTPWSSRATTRRRADAASSHSAQASTNITRPLI